MTTLIIGLDGADWRIIEPLLDAGQLPTLKRLVDTGCRGVLNSTIPPHSPPAWASMITGTNPGKHGIFGFTVTDSNYRNIPVEPMSKLRATPLWRTLNDHGISTGVVNIPILYPPEKVQGYLVCGMLTPRNATVFTYPENLSEVIGNPAENWIIGEHLSPGDSLEESLGEIKTKTKRQADLVLSMLDKCVTSFLMVVFDGSDKVQHFFWKYCDFAHPGHDPQASKELRDSISAYYRDLDNHLARITERLDSSNIFVVSDHGFTGVSKGFYIEQWLLDEGYLHLKSPLVSTSSRMLGDLVRGVWQNVARLNGIRNWLKRGTLSKRLLKKARDSLYDQGAYSSDNIDWDKTKVFFAGRTSWALRINLRGRERFGIVSDGEEYANLVHGLKMRLSQVRDPESQRPVISHVYHRDELYSGSQVDQSPDLILVPGQSYMLQEGFPNFLFGSSLWHGRDISGAHRREGIFIASGPDVKKSDTWVDVDILDMVPTVLYLCHIPIPGYIDGKVLTQIVQEDVQTQRPIEYTSMNESLNMQSDGYTSEERAMIEEHLRALGYL
jgi:predicted AlkP superfamily phosphohydrolase/phosphomutase